MCTLFVFFRLLTDPELQWNECMPIMCCFCLQFVQYLVLEVCILSTFCIRSILVAVKIVVENLLICSKIAPGEMGVAGNSSLAQK